MQKHFLYGIGDDVSMEDNEITQMQYNDYVNTGKYYDEKHYEELLNNKGQKQMCDYKPMVVSYKYENGDEYGDLICDLTIFMDFYLLGDRVNNLAFRTYLHNDIGLFSQINMLQIAFRVPRSNQRRHICKEVRQ